MKTIIFAGPSAVGKTYIANQLVREFPDIFEHALLYTTRIPRPGEKSLDRIFISNEKFESMKQDKQFIISDEFSGNLYGFTKEAIYPGKKHLLLNAWPWLIPQFSKIDHAIIIGMQAEDGTKKMLIDRMKDRGDSDEVIEKRPRLIDIDQDDLKKYASLTEESGAYFIIENDETIPKKIIPWIYTKLNLKQ